MRRRQVVAWPSAAAVRPLAVRAQQPATPLIGSLSGTIKRRELITLIGGAAGWPLTARAQQPAVKVARIGLLVTGTLDSARQRANVVDLRHPLSVVDAFRQGLHELGYVEGRSVVIEYRAADSRLERLPDLARELVALNVDVIAAASTPAGLAARQATATIPIVVANITDPVHDGLVDSLARPGGNITGTAILVAELVPKRLALLKELLPNTSRMAALWDPNALVDRAMRHLLEQVRGAAGALGLELAFVEARSPDALDRAFDSIVSARAEALLPGPSAMFFGQRRRIIDLAAAHRLPGMFGSREFVEIGGLISYGPNIVAVTKRCAAYVDKILKGAKPSDLPVEQPTTFELVINLKTAKALGITVPPTVIALANEVIE